MKIQIASDLHLEFMETQFPRYHGIEPTEADVLVLAGDIHRDIKAAWAFAEWKVPVVYVHGNHEAYGLDIDTLRTTFAKLAGPGAIVHNYEDGKLWTSAPTVHYLEQTSFIYQDVRFLGCCLWTDYALIHPDMVKRCMEYAELGLNDHRQIRIDHRMFTARDAASRHKENLTWLGAQLAQPFAGKTVVVTHHAPHYNSVHPRYAGQLLNAAFVNNLEPFILQYQPTLWVHGHTHDSFDYQVGQTRVVANPRGYPRQLRQTAYPADLTYENKMFNPALVLEI